MTYKQNPCSTVIIIPVRMGSSRFYGKPLVDLNGIPMLHRIYSNMSNSKLAQAVWIATPDLEIAQYCHQNGLNYVLTSSLHERCTDRCHEALQHITAITNSDFNSIVMVQGDEPLIKASSIDSMISLYPSQSDTSVIQLVAPITSNVDFHNPNIVKVLVKPSSQVAYMSRCPIPHTLSDHPRRAHRQVCAMFLTREKLELFSKLPQSPTEKIESIDMLRFIDNDIPIQSSSIDYFTHPIDIPSDINLVRPFL